TVQTHHTIQVRFDLRHEQLCPAAGCALRAVNHGFFAAAWNLVDTDHSFRAVAAVHTFLAYAAMADVQVARLDLQRGDRGIHEIERPQRENIFEKPQFAKHNFQHKRADEIPHNPPGSKHRA